MTVEDIKQMLDAFYKAKRIRDMLPELPEGVSQSYIRFLDAIEKLQRANGSVRISDLSAKLRLQPPGVTRTVKEMEEKGFLAKQTSPDDGRVTYITITESGAALSEEFNTRVFESLGAKLPDISQQDAETVIRVIERFYAVMSGEE